MKRERERDPERERRMPRHEHTRRNTRIPDGAGGWVQECVTCYSFLKTADEMFAAPRRERP